MESFWGILKMRADLAETFFNQAGGSAGDQRIHRDILHLRESGLELSAFPLCAAKSYRPVFDEGKFRPVFRRTLSGIILGKVVRHISGQTILKSRQLFVSA